MAEPTRLDPTGARSDSGDAAGTRLDPLAGAAKQAPPAHAAQRRFPAELSARFEAQWQFPAGGAEADVYRVLERATGTQRVLKLYRLGLQPKAEVLERLAQSQSPYIIGLHEYGEAGGLWYELLEYARYGSLRMLMRASAEHGGAERLARETVHQLHEALLHLHARNIVHRDLKPENVLVRGLEPLSLALTDFGISSVLELSQKVTGVMRTLRYGAPEASSGAIGQSVDWWSLGVIVLEMIDGRHPYEGLTDIAVLREQMTRDIGVDHVADPRLRELCRGLLQRDPERRWGADFVGRWLRGESMPAQDVLRREEERRPREGGDPTGTRPYSFQGEHYFTAAQLARAFATNIPEARKHWRRGFVVPWLREDLRAPDLADFAQRLAEVEGKPDQQLMRFIYHVDPALPLTYEGLEITPAELDGLRRQAFAGSGGSAALLAAIFRADLLRHAPSPELRNLGARWRDALAMPEGEASDHDIVRAYHVRGGVESHDLPAAPQEAAAREPPVARVTPTAPGGGTPIAPHPPASWGARLQALAAMPLPQPSADPIQEAQAAALGELQRELGRHAASGMQDAGESDPAGQAAEAEALIAELRRAHGEFRRLQMAAFASGVRRTIERAQKSDPNASLALRQAWTRIALPDDTPFAAQVTGLLTQLVSAEMIIGDAHDRASAVSSRGRSAIKTILHTVGAMIVLPAGCEVHRAAFIQSYPDPRGYGFVECKSFAACGYPGLAFFVVALSIYVGLAFVLPWRARLRQRRLQDDARRLVMRLLGEIHGAAGSIGAQYDAGRNPELDRLLDSPAP